MKEQVKAAQRRVHATPERHRELRLWLRMLTSTSMLEKQIRERLRTEFNTTLPRFDVMAAVYRCKEGLRMGELSRWLMVSNGNVTGIINRLADEGLIRREQRPDDKRSTYVALTGKGEREFEAMSASHEGWMRSFFAGLSEAEMLTLQDLLGRVKESVANITLKERSSK